MKEPATFATHRALLGAFPAAATLGFFWPTAIAKNQPWPFCNGFRAGIIAAKQRRSGLK